MTQKLTIRLDSASLDFIDCRSETLGINRSEYIRMLIANEMAKEQALVTSKVDEEGIALPIELYDNESEIVLPERIRNTIEDDMEQGWFRDEADCLLHYLRLGMQADAERKGAVE